MNDRQYLPDREERVFRLRPSAAPGAVLWLLVGIIAFGMAAVGLVVAGRERVGLLPLHLMTTLPSLIGVGAILAAWMTARTPRLEGGPTTPLSGGGQPCRTVASS